MAENFIPTDFGDVPDTVPAMAEGLYTLEVDRAEFHSTDKGNSVRVYMQVVDPSSEYANEPVTDFIFLNPNPKRCRGHAKLKKLMLSGGMTPPEGGLNLDTLKGLQVRAYVTIRTYRDKDTDEEREATNVKDYIVE